MSCLNISETFGKMSFERVKCLLLLLVIMVALLVDITRTKTIRSAGKSKRNVREICKKDVLLIVDTSYTVGRMHFNRQVKPFLKDLVTDKTLNVRPHGTRISLMLFSSYSNVSSKYYKKRYDRTKVVIPFSKHYDGDVLKDYISRLHWRDVRGGHTRTDKALEIANNEVFPLKSPLNHRRSANDIIILITDGKPHGVRSAIQDSLANAQKLKEKDVLIIGVGVGDKIRRRRFWNILNDIASPGQAIRTHFNTISSIKEMLAKQTCQNAAVRCECPVTQAAPVYVKPSHTSAVIAWKVPVPSCDGLSKLEVAKTIVYPPVTSPHAFEPGKHTVSYKFVLKEGQDVNCSVKFEVKACACPSSDLAAVQVQPGERNAEVSWLVPVPSCFKYQAPTARNLLPIGSHSIDYTYNIDEKFNVTCKVNVEVKGSLCRDRAFNADQQECCCGVIHEKKPGFQCCAEDYYDAARFQCCGGSNIRKKNEACPRSR